MTFKIYSIFSIAILTLLLGCATPSEIRQSGFNRTVVVPGTSEYMANCFAGKLDNVVGTLSHLVRKEGVQYSVVSRNAEQSTSVVDFREIGASVEAKIYMGPAIFGKDRMSDKFEATLKECASGK